MKSVTLLNTGRDRRRAELSAAILQSARAAQKPRGICAALNKIFFVRKGGKR